MVQDFPAYRYECRERIGADDAPPDDNPPRCACGGVLRPDVVFFGEAIPAGPMIKSQEAAMSCAVLLVVGTSGVVQPLRPFLSWPRGRVTSCPAFTRRF